MRPSLIWFIFTETNQEVLQNSVAVASEEARTFSRAMLITSWKLSFQLVTSCAGTDVCRACRSSRYVVTFSTALNLCLIKGWWNSSAFSFKLWLFVKLNEVPNPSLNMLHKCWFSCEEKGRESALKEQNDWISLNWFWNLKVEPCSWGIKCVPDYRQPLSLGCWEGVFSAVLMVSRNCHVLFMIDLEGYGTKQSWASRLLPVETSCSMLPPNFAVLFFPQELPAANFAPVYRHYSHGATCSQLTDFCTDLMMPPRATTETLRCYKAIRNTNVTSYVCACRSGC